MTQSRLLRVMEQILRVMEQIFHIPSFLVLCKQTNPEW